MVSVRAFIFRIIVPYYKFLVQKSRASVKYQGYILQKVAFMGALWFQKVLFFSSSRSEQIEQIEQVVDRLVTQLCNRGDILMAQNIAMIR